MKGFALMFSILFLLLLTLFSFALLTTAEGYYSSTRHLFENQNARVSCEQAAAQLIDRHNLEATPTPVFFDPLQWPNLNLIPYSFNTYAICASLKAPWNSDLPNLLTVSATKGPYRSQQQLQVAQRRFENFALYSDSSFSLPGDSLIDGPVFVRESLELLQPGVQFRDTVQADVFPEQYASFRKRTLHTLDYPSVTELLQMPLFEQEAEKNGIRVSEKDPRFWNGDHYELDLDQLQIRQWRRGWELVYKGVTFGSPVQLILLFDAPLQLIQGDQPVTSFYTKPPAPVTLVSASTILISAPLHTLESAAFRHPLCLISGEAIHLTSKLPNAVRIQASLVALGSEERDGQQVGFVIEPGSGIASAAQKLALIHELRASTFLLHEELLNETVTAIENDQAVVWIRGGLVLSSDVYLPPDLLQLHLQASENTDPQLAALPFVYQLEGTQQWR